MHTTPPWAAMALVALVLPAIGTSQQARVATLLWARATRSARRATPEVGAEQAWHGQNRARHRPQQSVWPTI